MRPCAPLRGSARLAERPSSVEARPPADVRAGEVGGGGGAGRGVVGGTRRVDTAAGVVAASPLVIRRRRRRRAVDRGGRRVVAVAGEHDVRVGVDVHLAGLVVHLVGEPEAPEVVPGVEEDAVDGTPPRSRPGSCPSHRTPGGTSSWPDRR